MPGPPPPPPAGGPPPMMPPAPFFSSAGGGSDGRSDLLLSIRKGAKLKKAVTVDKSAPVIGKVTSTSSSNSSSVSASPYRGASNNVPNGLGGLFAGGMPKLKPTGKNLGGSINTVSSGSNIRTPESPSPKNFSTIQTELKKQMANDMRNMNRGPPPPAPVRSYNNGDDSSSRQLFGTKNGNSNGFHQNPSLPNLTSPKLQLAPPTHHRKTNSSVSLHTVDSGSADIAQNHPRPVINHGKPNLAPKPPVLNGKPAAPPKRLIVNGKPVGRAQSMRSPRSPSPQSPDNTTAPDFGAAKFGTVRNLSQALNQNLGQSLGNLSHLKSRPPLNGRPTAPPPSVPNTPPPPPPNKMVKPPNHAPPPPPIVIPQAPSSAPPPPPHRTAGQAPARPPPATPHAPPPPPRHSSMTGVNNGRRPSSTSSSNTSSNSSLENRFNFHSVTEFPRPMPFRGVPKVFNTRQVGSKQQAPPPPTQIQLSSGLWESSTC